MPLYDSKYWSPKTLKWYNDNRVKTQVKQQLPDLIGDGLDDDDEPPPMPPIGHERSKKVPLKANEGQGQNSKANEIIYFATLNKDLPPENAKFMMLPTANAMERMLKAQEEFRKKNKMVVRDDTNDDDDSKSDTEKGDENGKIAKKVNFKKDKEWNKISGQDLSPIIPMEKKVVCITCNANYLMTFFICDSCHKICHAGHISQRVNALKNTICECSKTCANSENSTHNDSNCDDSVAQKKLNLSGKIQKNQSPSGFYSSTPEIQVDND